MYLTRAKKFTSFKQGQFLGNIGVAINFDTGSTVRLSADPKGVCYALCCVWMKEIKKNRKYMADLGKDILEASRIQESLKTRFDHSNCDNDLALQGIGVVVRKDSIATYNPNVFKDALDNFASSDKANFLLFVISGTNSEGNWAHAIVAKLNQSSTGGWLNLSYPCAFFDPNIGQGMYNNHTDMAADIQEIINAYGTTGVRGYTIQCDKIN